MEIQLWNCNLDQVSTRNDQLYSQLNDEIRARHLSNEFFTFETCLRRIWLRVTHSGLSATEHSFSIEPNFKGAEAYKFLLSVLCGLESPFLGETEVFGQFKEQSRHASHVFESLFKNIFADVKYIRSNCLRGLGSQSYGGISRSILRNSKSVCVIGAGVLGKELVLWLKTEILELHWFARTEREMNGHTVLGLDKLKSMAVQNLIIAAPVTNEELIFLEHQNVHKILDFRAETSYAGNARETFSFAKIKSLAESNGQKKEQVRTEAHLLMDKLVKNRELQARVRPQGWDDLCG